MLCFAGICKDANQEKAATDLLTRLKELQADLEVSKRNLANAREEREKVERNAAETEQRANELLAKKKTVDAMTEKALRMQATDGCASGCFSFLMSANEEIALQKKLESLKADLAATQESVVLVRAQAEGVQQNVAVQTTMSSPLSNGVATKQEQPKETIEVSVQKEPSYDAMFMRDVNDFRHHTPLDQRIYKNAINDLIKELAACENGLQEEKVLLDAYKAETQQHEKIVKNLSGQTEVEPFAFMKSGGAAAWFRGETPAKQREMKVQLMQIVQEMEAAQEEKVGYEIARDTSARKLSHLRERGVIQDNCSTEASNKFAFQQPA
jgi:hypothetical protein